ncbi:MAG: hypothetical protein JJT89_09255 [Nitriliruptoraceae bacterium]|nr:hypothetical protein [Nitriliruptoraceae bacterium]
MTPGVLFAIGAVLFFMGGLAMIIVGLDVFGDWRIREKQDDEDTYLDDETAGDVMADPLHRRRPH